jgi:hypothetical protein
VAKAEARKAAIVASLNNETFEIAITSMNDQQANDSYSIKVNKGTVDTYLPYFGTAYYISFDDGGAIHFTQPAIEYKYTQATADSYVIRFNIEDKSELYKFLITVYDTGKTTVSVVPRNKEAIRYEGQFLTK